MPSFLSIGYLTSTNIDHYFLIDTAKVNLEISISMQNYFILYYQYSCTDCSDTLVPIGRYCTLYKRYVFGNR